MISNLNLNAWMCKRVPQQVQQAKQTFTHQVLSSYVNFICKNYLCWLYMLAPMQCFKKFKFLVIFKLGQILGCYKPTLLKKNLALEI